MEELTICLDVGGSNTRVVLFDQKLKKLDHETFTTDAADATNTFARICKFINKHKNVTKIGIAMPGITNYETGLVINTPNLNWNNFNFFNYLKTHTTIKTIKAGNDANLMALANHHYFKQNHQQVTQFFTISTGLGGGLIINDKIYTGAYAQAQELANAPLAWIRKKGKDLTEGALELFASGSGLAFWGQKKGFESTADIFRHYQKNDDATKIVDNGIETLANLIATSSAMLNPNLFVFDGSVARNHHWYIEKAIAIAKTRMFPAHYDHVEYKIAELGDDAALIGAFYLVK